MIETLTLNTRKSDSPVCKARISPLRRGERNNVTLTVAVRRDRRPYDLTGMTAHLVWQAADGKLVGPVPMEVSDPAAGTVRCTLPDACYAAVGMARAYVELRMGAELVDTSDEMVVKVLDCIDADAEQARNRAESARASSEALRVSAETSRADAESLREKAFAKSMGEVDAATKTANAANSAATKAVSDAKAAIAEVKATEAKLYPAAENILVGSETGAVAYVDDAFNGASLRGITIEGAFRQDGTPSPEAPVPLQVVENPVVRVTGRNLLNPDTLAASTSYVYSVDGGRLTVKTRDGRAWDSVHASTALHAGTYCASGDYFEIRDELDNHIVINGSGLFTLARDSRLKVKVGTNAKSYPYVSKAQIERGVTASDYALYTSQALTFALPAEHPYLAKLPDGTADEIVADADGNVELVARVMKTVLDGSQSFVEMNIEGIETYYETSSPIGSGALPAEQWGGLFDRFTTANPYTLRSGACAYAFANTNGVIFRIRPSETFANTAGFINWLKSNPATSYSADTEPKTYQLGKIEMPRAQDSIVNVWTDAEVTPMTGIEYVRDVNIVVSNLESAIASITQG